MAFETPANQDSIEQLPNDKKAEIKALQEQFIESKQPLFRQFAGANGPVVKPGEAFVIIFGNPIVIEIGPEDWEKMQEGRFTEEEMVWSTFHEYAHFLDFLDNPEAMMQNFEDMRATAKRMAPRAQSIMAKRFPQLPSHLVGPGLENMLYQQISRFYNCLDDIYVNGLVAIRAARYRAHTGSEGERIQRLYREDLFAEPDLSYSPQSQQLGYALLRRFMVKDEETVVSAAVSSVLARITPNLANVLRPTGKHERQQHDPKFRYAYIKAMVEPEFWRLFFEDLENMPLPPAPQEKEGKGGSKQSEKPKNIQDAEESDDDLQNSQPLDDSTSAPSDKDSEDAAIGKNPWDTDEAQPSNPLNEEMLKTFIEGKKKAAEEGAARKPVEVPRLTPEERVRVGNINKNAKLAEQNSNLTPEQARKCAEEWSTFSESVREYKEALSRVFDSFMNSIQAQMRQSWEEGWRSGRFNIDTFIHTYGAAFISGTEEGDPAKFLDLNALESYDQQTFDIRYQLIPQRIVFRLILDNSVSMGQEGIMALKQLLVLLYESLKTFEARVNHNFRLNTPFVVDLEVHRFASTSEVIKPLGGKGGQELGAMVAALHSLDASGESTQDAIAWHHILEQLHQDPCYMGELKKGKAVEITTEITDGDTDTHQETQAALQTYEMLAGLGAANAIKITSADETDEEYMRSGFSTLFQGNGQPVRHPSDMTAAFTKLLEAKLAQLQKLVAVTFDVEVEE